MLRTKYQDIVRVEHIGSGLYVYGLIGENLLYNEQINVEIRQRRGWKIWMKKNAG